MRLSTKGRYGTRLMLELALSYDKRTVFLSEIGKAQGISVKYLEQLVRPLKIAGLIQSVRGAHGGYRLSRPPEHITLKEIITALEGRVKVVECISSSGQCQRISTCATKEIWDELSDRIADFFSKITLKDMVERYYKKNNTDRRVLMYNI